MSTKIAMLMRKPPYATVYPAEGFRAMLGMAVFEVPICVVFLDDGVYTLAKGQDPAGIDMKPLSAGFATLPDQGITEFYVHDRSLAERGLTVDDLVMPVTVASAEEIEKVLAGATAVLPF
jgi:tRNA 2-thiouridine synthesizing protein C